MTRFVGAVVVLCAVASCAHRTSTATGVGGDVTVFAAASLTEAFTAIGKEYEAKYPGAKATFNFAASSALAQQLTDGAPADVFAAADEATVQRLVQSKVVTGPATFAHNTLEIAVPRGNPKNVRSLSDLAKPGLLVALCAEQVPCGKAAARALSSAHAAVPGASREDNVKGVLTKVSLGEADAGIMYTTDLKAAAGKVDGVMIPAAENVESAYPIAVVSASRNTAGARAFVALVLSPAGRETMRRFGFL